MKSGVLPWRERAGILLVVLTSLSLLLYVAWGEMVRTNLRFQTERLHSQAQPLLAALQAHVQSGLATEQFSGFAALSGEMRLADPQLRSVSLETAAGRWLFDTQPPAAETRRVRLPVRTRFETVGWLNLAVDADAAHKPMRAYGAWLAASALLVAGLAFWRLLRAATCPNPLRAQTRILLWMLLAQTCVLSVVMWQVYTVGARSVAQSQAEALVSRLTEVYQHGLVFDDFSDITDVLTQERVRSRHVQQLSVHLNNRLVFRSRDDATALGQTVALTELAATRNVQADEPVTLTVTLSVPLTVIVTAIARNLKNFAFLFVATVFAALLMLRLMHGFGSVTDKTGHRVAPDGALAETETVKVSALLFLAVFCDQLTAAFLPPWIADVATRSAYAPGSGAWAFTAYFVAFALALIPAQRQAAQGRSRGLLMWGATAVCLGAVLLMFQPHFLWVVLARACSGAGQGLVFVAAQSLLLGWSRASGALGANTAIVFQFNAGMICGLALGSLLVVYLEPIGVFRLVAVLAGLTAGLATALQAPADAQVRPAVKSRTQPRTWRAFRVWRDPGFAIPALCIGIPSKAVMTGVLVYGLPLLLASAGLEREETGQLLLFYAVGVLLCNHWIARRQPVVQRLRSWAAVAMCVSGIAIASLSPAFAAHPGWWSVPLVLLAILLLGMAHGAINAPVVTLVSFSAIARQHGGAAAATDYRLVERVGHVLGPIVFAHLLGSAGDSRLALHWLAIGVGSLGLVAFGWALRASALARRAAVRACCFLLCPAGVLSVLWVAGLSDAHAQRIPHADAAPITTAGPSVQDVRPSSPRTVPESQPVAWLSLTQAVMQHWTTKLSGEPASQRLILSPKSLSRPADAPVILLLLLKPSPAYDTAVSRMLEVWFEKGLAATVQVVHVGGELTAAHAALASAVRERAALVVGVGSDTTAFLHTHYRQGPLALLSVCAKDPVLMQQVASYEHGSGTQMAYTSLNAPVDVQLNHLLQVQPGLRELAIIVDRRNTSAWQTQTLPLEKRAAESGITVHRVIVDGEDDIATQLAQRMRDARTAMRKADANGAFSAFWITGSSAVFPHIRLINQTAGHVPVFSAVPDLVKAGADSVDVSIGVSFEENAYLAALYAQRIVSGQVHPGQLPVGVVSPPEIAINFMKTRQSGLRLPFSFFEKAGTVFNARGELIRWRGSRLNPDTPGGS